MEGSLEDFYTLGELMANNLEAKGVTASADDGLTTLANKILSVPFHWVTRITEFNVPSNPLTASDTIILSVHLIAYVEGSIGLFERLMKGATVKFYNNSEYIGESIVGADGNAVFEYELDYVGVYSFEAIFEENDEYFGCVSTTETRNAT